VNALWDVFASSKNRADFCGAWLSLQCVQVGEVREALLLLEQDAGSFAAAAAWPSGRTDFTHLAAGAQQCLAAQRGLIQRSATGSSVLVACPMEIDGRLHGAVVLDLKGRTDDDLEAAMQELRWGVGWLESHFLRRQGLENVQRLARARIALDVLAMAAEQSRLQDIALAVANDLASRFACDRVAFAIDRQGRTRLLALSHSAFFEKKSQFVAGLESAMDEALDQRRSVWWPPSEQNPQTSGVAIAHRDFAANRVVCSVLISSRGKGIGVLTFEREQGALFSSDDICGFEAIGGLLGPLVESRIELDRWFAGRMADKVRGLWLHIKDPRRPAFRVGMTMAAVLLLAILFIDGDYRVSAKSVVEGEVQRSVVAPFAGYIREAPVRAGMVVTKGQLLARLDDRDLLLDRQRWIAEREQHERRYRDALSRHERANSQVSLAQVAEVQSQLTLVEEKLTRADVVAPFDGVVVTGDLTQLLGSPVDQGKLLFEVAPLDAYRVILKVDDRDIRHVRASQSGRLMLAGLSGEALDFKVVNISMAQAEEGKNLFRVEAKLDRSQIPLRPGMEGVGKISVGEMSYAWIWTHRLFDWLRLQAWTWLP
jgi:multidrug resistance efflux pump